MLLGSIGPVVLDATQNSAHAGPLCGVAWRGVVVGGTERRFWAAFPSDVAGRLLGLLQLAAPSACRDALAPLSPWEQLDALANTELALLACAIGAHLPVELVDRVLAVRARRAALARQLGLELAVSV